MEPEETTTVEQELAFSEMEGSELFKPISSLRASQRLRLAAKVMPLAETGDDFTAEDIAYFADLMDYLEDGGFVTDLEGWGKFFDEKGLQEAMKLAMTYAGEAIGVRL
jgi:hypothetical protein